MQLTLADQEAAILTSYGEQFGYSLPKTIKFLLGKAAEQAHNSRTIPVYTLPEALEQKGPVALEDHRAGKTTEVTDFKSYFQSL